jgi:hypothetical protein
MGAASFSEHYLTHIIAILIKQHEFLHGLTPIFKGSGTPTQYFY